MTRRTPFVLACLLVLGACSGGETAESTTTTSQATTSTVESTTTTTGEDTTTTTQAPATTTGDETTVTTYPSAFASPLNGLASENELNLDRRAIGVKIDNHVNSRPQSGVLDADLVVETRVEAGLTRFIAFFHDNDIDYIGPIRSVRPTDSTIASAVQAPLVISGGQPWIQSLVAGRGVGLVGPGAGGMYRIPGRPAPHDLYGATLDMRAGADLQGYADTPPAPLYEIGEWVYPDAPATTITLDWSDAVTVEWTYADGMYTRVQDGIPHEVITRDGERTQIAVEVLVVLGGEFYTVSPTGEGSAVPAIDTVGTGPAWVFARGRIWQGAWNRAGIGDPFQLSSLDGTPAVVPPGFAWVSVFPQHRNITWS
jgi:hypothetical protein